MGFGDDLGDVEFSPHKHVVHMARLEALAAGGDVFPVTVELDPVAYCNHSCWWCVDPRHTADALDHACISSLLAEFRELGILGIVFKGGGEPTLHPDFAGIVAEAASLGFEVGIVSNGSRLGMLHGPIIDNASYLRVSIDGPTSQTHAALHGADDFGDIIEGVRLCMALRREDGKRHPVVGLSFAMDFSMIGMISEAVALGDGLGVDYVLFRPPFFEEVGREPTMSVEQGCQLRDAFAAAKRAYAGPMTVLVDNWVSDRDSQAVTSADGSPRRGSYRGPGANGIEHLTRRCLASPLLCVIAADRQVYPCCNLRAIDEWSLGTVDYAAGRTFKDVWHGQQRRAVMERIHRTECIRYCTHPMSRYNEVIEYLRTPRHHCSFV